MRAPTMQPLKERSRTWCRWFERRSSENENRKRKWFSCSPFPRHHFDTPDSTIWAQPRSSLATKYTHLSICCSLSSPLCSHCCILVFPQVEIDRIISSLWCGGVQRVTIWQRERQRRERERARGGKTTHYSVTFYPSPSWSSISFFRILRVILEDLQMSSWLSQIIAVCWKDRLTATDVASKQL